MNALLFEMIAARATASGNPAVADLLARIRSSSGADPKLDAQEFLAHQANSNPVVDVVAKHLAHVQSNGSSCQHPPVIDAGMLEKTPDLIEHPRQEPLNDSAGALSELRQHVKSMFAELKLLRERTDILAAAL